MTSPLSRWLSPAGRVLCALLGVTALATAPLVASRRHLGLVVLLLLALAALARPRVRWLIRRGSLALMAALALVLPFVLAGQTERALDVALRSSSAIGVALMFAATFGPTELPRALSTLRVPRALAGTVHTLLWQLEHVGDEGRRLLLARRLRGAQGAFGAELLSALLARTAERAERVDLALALRGAGVLEARHRWRGADVVATCAALALGAALHLGG